MTLTELRYALALATEKNFNRAAKKCHISQPSLSAAISKLESRLGVVIFERGNNHLGVTDIGKKILAQAKFALDEAEKILIVADQGKSQCSLPLNIGAIYTAAPYLFPKFIPAFIELAPKTPLFVTESFTDNLIDSLKTGKLDAIFIGVPVSEPGLVFKKIYSEKLLVLMKKSHPLSKNEFIFPADLVNEKILLLGKNHCLRTQVLNLCPFSGNTDDQAQMSEGLSLDTLRHMVASGMGITILPCSAAHMDHYSSILCAKEIASPDACRDIGLVWRASFPRTKAIDLIIRSLDKGINKSSVCRNI